MHDRDTIYVDGAWTPSTGAGHIDVVDPRTEEVVGHVPQGAPEDVDAAVRAARRAFEPWAATSLGFRTTVQPAASAGAILATTWCSG